MDTARIREGIRKMRFSTILGRRDAGEMAQETAAELLGMSVRSFQRWKERGGRRGGLVDRRAARRRGGAPAKELERMLGLYRDKYNRLHNPALTRTDAKAAQLQARLYGDELHLHRAGLVRPAPKPLGAPQGAAAPADAQHDAASGRVAARVDRGPAGARSHLIVTHGRRHERDLLEDPRGRGGRLSQAPCTPSRIRTKSPRSRTCAWRTTGPSLSVATKAGEARSGRGHGATAT